MTFSKGLGPEVDLGFWLLRHFSPCGVIQPNDPSKLLVCLKVLLNQALEMCLVEPFTDQQHK